MSSITRRFRTGGRRPRGSPKAVLTMSSRLGARTLSRKALKLLILAAMSPSLVGLLDRERPDQASLRSCPAWLSSGESSSGAEINSKQWYVLEQWFSSLPLSLAFHFVVTDLTRFVQLRLPTFNPFSTNRSLSSRSSRSKSNMYHHDLGARLTNLSAYQYLVDQKHFGKVVIKIE